MRGKAVKVQACVEIKFKPRIDPKGRKELQDDLMPPEIMVDAVLIFKC